MDFTNVKLLYKLLSQLKLLRLHVYLQIYYIVAIQRGSINNALYVNIFHDNKHYTRLSDNSFATKG